MLPSYLILAYVVCLDKTTFRTSDWSTKNMPFIASEWHFNVSP